MDAITHRSDIGKNGKGAQALGLVKMWDDALGEYVHVDRISTLGHPATYLPIGPVDGIAGASPVLLPFNGTGTAQGGALGFIRMPADHPDIDRRGLIVLIMGGTGVGQWRRVATYDHADNRKIIPNRPFAIAPDATSVPVLLVPTWCRAEMCLRGEYSAGATGVAKVRPVRFSYPELPSITGEVGGRSIPAPSEPDVDGVEVSMENTGLSIFTHAAGWTNAASRTYGTRGGVGMAFVVRPPTTGSILVRACAV